LKISYLINRCLPPCWYSNSNQRPQFYIKYAHVSDLF